MTRRRAVIVPLLAAATLACLVAAAGAGVLASPGTKLWTTRVNNSPANGDDYGEAITHSADGTKLYATGRSYGGATTGNDALTTAYNAGTGAVLWKSRYNGPVNGSDTSHALAVSPDGTRVFVGGQSAGNSAAGVSATTVGYSASTGAKLWAARYNGPAGGGFDAIYGIAVSGDGTKVFVTGRSDGGSTDSDIATIAYNAATGAKLWAARYDGPPHGSDGSESLELTPDGTKVLVTGYSYGTSTNSDFETVAYNASTGARLWAARYDGGSGLYDSAYSLDLSGDGTKAFVTGQSLKTASSFDITTIAYKVSTGSKLWVSQYDGPAHAYDSGDDVAVSGDGAKVFVTGEASAGATNGYDFVTIGYNASTGSKLWSTRYNGPASKDEQAYQVETNGDGSRVYVAGGSMGGSPIDYDYATVAYGPTGTQLWAQRYNGPGNGYDEANGLTLSPDATKVYVTGVSFGGSTTHQDEATIAYQG
jgi:PQQ-like domain